MTQWISNEQCIVTSLDWTIKNMDY